MGFILFLIPIPLSVWLIKYFFPLFYAYGNRDTVGNTVITLSLVIYGLIYFCFGTEPKDYVASKIKSDIHKILKELHLAIDSLSKLGQKVTIETECYEDYQFISAKFDTKNVTENKLVSKLIVSVHDTINRLNASLRKAKDRNLEVKIIIMYWEYDELIKDGISQPYQYRFLAEFEY